MAFLRIMNGERKGQTYEIDRDEIVIGRAAGTVVTLDDPASSSHHCSVFRSGRRFSIKDMDSTNGTRLNSSSIKEYRLSPKDVITVGATDILFDGGDEVEPFHPPVAPVGPQGTVRLGPPSGSAHPGGGFGTKKDSKLVWVIVIAVIGVLVLAALTIFVSRWIASKPA